MTIKRAVKENVIQELLSLNLTHEPILELARDMFMFSIYMRGMPFVDIAHLRKDNMINNNMSYQRQENRPAVIGSYYVLCTGYYR